MAKMLLEKANISFKTVIATEQPDLALHLEVKQAPTLVVITNGLAEKIVNLSNIKKFIEENRG